MRPSGRHLAVALLLVIAIPASPMRAETDVERAKALAERAVEEGRSGDMRKALALFEAAYALDPAPTLLYNIGRVRERLGDLDGAREALQDLLKLEIDEALRAKARAALDQVLKAWYGHVQVQTPAVGARVEIDGQPVAKTPMIESVRVAPGRHTVRLVPVGGEPISRGVKVAAGATIVLDMSLAARPDLLPVTGGPVDPTRPAHGPRSPARAANDLSGRLDPTAKASPSDRTVMWVLIGAGAAVVTAGAVTAAVLLSADGGGTSPDSVWTIPPSPQEGQP